MSLLRTLLNLVWLVLAGVWINAAKLRSAIPW
jgi:uncharacterized membrane protein YccF (DUF307 family)